MARIRTVKPELFRHEGLQELEIQHPGAYPMLVFIGLFGQSDKFGRFEWRPRQLKLDILPFLPYEMADTLAILEEAGFITRYEVAGREYGSIPTFKEHQRVTGKEAQEPAKYPGPAGETQGDDPGSNGETPGDEPRRQEGKGKEGKGNGVGRSRAVVLPEGFSISDRVRKWAKERGFDGYLDAHFEFFVSYCRANGKTYVDHDEALMNCIRADWGDVRKKATAAGFKKAGEKPWFLTSSGISTKARELGLPMHEEDAPWPEYRDAVLLKAGITPAQFNAARREWEPRGPSR